MEFNVLEPADSLSYRLRTTKYVTSRLEDSVLESLHFYIATV